MTVRVSIAQAERMLGTKYNVYRHIASSERVVRTMGYSLPRELHAHIDMAAPTTYFGTMRSMHAGTNFLKPQTKFVTDASTPSSCKSAITPTCLRTLYNTTNYVPLATNINKLGVAGYLEEYANRDDLQVRECPGFVKAFGTHLSPRRSSSNSNRMRLVLATSQFRLRVVWMISQSQASRSSSNCST